MRAGRLGLVAGRRSYPPTPTQPSKGKTMFTRSTLKRSAAALGAAGALLAGAVPAGAVAPAATTPGHGSGALPTAPSSTTATGIIMKDGNICDPIRHIGC